MTTMARININLFNWISIAGILVTASSKPLECFWCGPMAHRIQDRIQPPDCDGPEKHVICDQSHLYCATVYTSPPHKQSRICSKTYTEECYTEFYNSTGTWKITCPCKGDLCNVRNARRDREFFDILNKLVDKTFKHYRFKRSNIEHSKLMKAQLDQERAEQEHEMQENMIIPSHMKTHIAKQCRANILRRITNLWPPTTPHYTYPIIVKRDYREQLTSSERIYKDYAREKIFKKQNISTTLLHDNVKMDSSDKITHVTDIISSLEQHRSNGIELRPHITLVLLLVFLSAYNLSII